MKDVSPSVTKVDKIYPTYKIRESWLNWFLFVINVISLNFKYNLQFFIILKPYYYEALQSAVIQ